MTDSALRKVGIYTVVFFIGYLGMLVIGFDDGRNYLLFNAIAIGGLVGMFGTAGWYGIQHE